MEILDRQNPDVSLVHFRGPDVEGHAGNWEGYLDAIQRTDLYVAELWDFLQQHPYYKGQTALWITNDHGRHLDGISDGFSGHGDDCDGCRRISLLTLGPGLPHGKVITEPYQQTDLLPTAAKIFGFSSLSPNSHLIPELVK
jgi:arylsulfatase A-like enzyme